MNGLPHNCESLRAFLSLILQPCEMPLSRISANTRLCLLTYWRRKPSVAIDRWKRTRAFRSSFEVGAFVGDQLVAWSFSKGEGSQLHMVNSGVLPNLRRRGIYSSLVEATISYAEANGFSKIFSRHVPSNNAVIIPKLRLGFIVSAFEYSEVYGPLVHLTYITGTKRRELYRVRSAPIVPPVPC